MTIRDSLRAVMADPSAGNPVKLATVLEVNGDKCNVELLDTEIEITDVRLQADTTNGALYAPKVGSEVIIQRIADHDYIVIMFSAIDEIKFLDGSYGGLTKTQELKTELDKTNAVLQAVVDSLKNWVVSPNDGGAALKAFFNSTLGIKVVGDFSDIENEKITHGNV